MLTYYKLRVDLQITTVSELIKTLEKGTDAYAYVTEKLDTNPHIHFYLATTVSNAALRARIRNIAGKGNKSYSLKVIEEQYPIEYLAYLHKEGEVTYVNVPNEIIEKAKAYNALVAAEIKEKKANKKTQVQKIIAHIEALQEENPNIGWNPPNVTKLVIEYYRDNCILVREFAIIANVQTILLQKCPEYYKTLYSRIQERIDFVART